MSTRDIRFAMCWWCSCVTVVLPGTPWECGFCANRIVNCGDFKIRITDARMDWQ